MSAARSAVLELAAALDLPGFGAHSKRTSSSKTFGCSLAFCGARWLVVAVLAVAGGFASFADDVPLFRVFETSIVNPKQYRNKFTDVTLHAVFTAPSGKETTFWAFYDGDGNGGPDGQIWKLRFLPTEIGPWTYTYRWSDRTPNGSGRFQCVQAGAGKGILKAYAANPRWFAYNGTDPVFLRSYYVGGSVVSPIEWVAPHVYEPLIRRGYNHFQFNQLLPVEWVQTDKWSDAPSALTKYLFESNNPRRTMNLDVWKNLEEHIRWLNNHDIGVHCFQGFDGKELYTHTKWAALSSPDKDFYVQYVCSRLSPFANIAGWNFTWETNGDGPERELMDLLIRYDPWEHLRTYEDEFPRSNHYDDPRYTFAAVENHGYSEKGDYEAYSHHQATRDAYEGKPVYMTEGNGLWKAAWKATETSIRRCAWAVVTAGGSFTWDWATPNASESWRSDEIFASDADEYMDVLYDVMTRDVVFHAMTPHDELIEGSTNTFCLAEIGRQYLVYAETGKLFRLTLAKGNYSVTWIDAKTNMRESGQTVTAAQAPVLFFPPDIVTDWLLVLRRDETP